MTAEFSNVDRLTDTPIPGRVNAAGGSNPDKKDQGFSKALKDKLKEKLDKDGDHKDELVLSDEQDDDHDREHRSDDSSDEPVQTEPVDEPVENVEGAEAEAPGEHIDLTA
ncbi:MAG: hypothetical protein KAU36_09250 [candidate division Zixibacteria bacterium]|nr:hypothetical protein [candidate division Zixibacteria bacterium]